jgi:hypothetical protein
MDQSCDLSYMIDTDEASVMVWAGIARVCHHQGYVVKDCSAIR